MKFLLNNNVPRTLGRLLDSLGHSARHVGDIGMARVADQSIVDEARAHAEVIITHDLDYGHLIAFSGQTKPSVITLRLRNSRPDRVVTRLQETWSEIEGPLCTGAIVTLEDAALRIRRLPEQSVEGEGNT